MKFHINQISMYSTNVTNVSFNSGEMLSYVPLPVRRWTAWSQFNERRWHEVFLNQPLIIVQMTADNHTHTMTQTVISIKVIICQSHNMILGVHPNTLPQGNTQRNNHIIIPVFHLKEHFLSSFTLWYCIYFDLGWIKCFHGCECDSNFPTISFWKINL